MQVKFRIQIGNPSNGAEEIKVLPIPVLQLVFQKDKKNGLILDKPLCKESYGVLQLLRAALSSSWCCLESCVSIRCFKAHSNMRSLEMP